MRTQALCYLALALSLPATMEADTLAPSAKLVAGDSVAFDRVGFSVALSGSTAMMGSLVDGGSGLGKAYVFRFDGSDWVEAQKLTASDGVAGDLFGLSLALTGDTALVGAPGDENQGGSENGSVYVFRLDGDTWVEDVKLVASDGEDGDMFGIRVAFAGQAAIVGANRRADLGSSTGAAYVFRDNGSAWLEEARLFPSDPAAGQVFGAEVAGEGDVAVVSAPGDANSTGAVYVFRWNGAIWVQEDKLTASDGEEQEVFGSSVSLSGDTLLVGAYWDDDKGSTSGSAYVFRFDGSTWIEEAKLTASDGSSMRNFGSAVGVQGDTAVIGQPRDSEQAPFAGAAYLFRREEGSWHEVAKLLDPLNSFNEQLGAAISISGENALISASKFNVDLGAALVFPVPQASATQAHGVAWLCILVSARRAGRRTRRAQQPSRKRPEKQTKSSL